MNQIWKRTASLALSAVLLWNSVPMGAFATEETTAATEPTVVETQPVETEPQVTETQPAGDAVQPVSVQSMVTGGVAGNQAENKGTGSTTPDDSLDYPSIDGVMLGANDPRAEYNEETKVLTLKQSVGSVSSDIAFTVKVNDGAKVEIGGALSSKAGIVITGKGQLTVGSIVAKENLKIENTNVRVGKNRENNEAQKTLISVKETITLEGEAHLVTATGHKAADTVNPTENPFVKIQGNGYYRTATEDDFVAITVESLLNPPPEYLEVVADEHLTYEAVDADKHNLKCSDNCKLTPVAVKAEEHTNERQAGCGKKAKCSKCGEYGEISNEHLQEDTECKLVDTVTHKEVYKCCGADKADSVENHSITYTVDTTAGNILHAACECELTGTITINADSCEYDGSAHGATVTLSEGLTVETPKIYYIAVGETDETKATDTAPDAVGKYKAYIQMGEGENAVTAEVEFEIEPEKVDITVTVAGEYVYNGLEHKPGKEKLTVKMEGNTVNADDYSIEKYENNTNAGTAKVVVSVKNGDYNVTGEGNFTIARALKPTISDANKPKPEVVRENEDKTTPVAVLTAENKGKTDDGLALEYSWNLGNGYSTEIPKQEKNGSYWLYYRSVESGNYQGRAEGSVKVVVTPYLKATSGTKLAEVTLPAGWKWNTTENGPAAETTVDRKNHVFKADYTHPSDQTLSASLVDVEIVVESIVPEVTLEPSHYSVEADDKGVAQPVEPNVTVKLDGKNLESGKDYEVSYANNVNPGTATLTVKAKGTHQFEDITKEFVIYNFYSASLSSDNVTMPPELQSKGYATKADIEKALDDQLNSAQYPENQRRYYNVAMNSKPEKDESKVECTYNPEYWPDPNDIVFLLPMAMPTGANKDSSFKAVAIYTVGSKAHEAGSFVEIPVNINAAGKPQIRVNGYMAVCLAVEKEFRVTAKAAENGTVKLISGTDTTEKDSLDAMLTGEKVTVVPKPKAGYCLTKLYYSYDNGANTTKVDIVKDANGNYTFEMPAKNIEIHAEFDEVTLNQPIVKDLTYTGQAQQLVDAAVVTEGSKVTYKLNSMTEYTDNVANIKGTAAGAYKVFYRYMDSDGNVKKEDSVIAVIRPKMEPVEFGMTLKDITKKLPDGFSWNAKNVETDAVGNVGKNTFFADFSPEDVAIVVQDTANQVDKSEIKVEIEVQPKAAAPDVSLDSDHVKYESGKDNEAKVTVKVGTETLKRDVDYKLAWKNVTKPGIATVTVKGINYTFEETETYYIYQPKYDKLDSTTVELSDDLVAANYTKDSIKTKLSEQFDEAYPELNRSFFNCAMSDGESGYDYDIEMWPSSAVTFYLDYPANTDKNDTFKAFMMRSTDEGEGRTGDIEALTVTKDAVSNEPKLKIELKKPAVVALAYEVKGTYEVTVAASDNGTVKFSVGEDTETKTSAEVEYGQVITVHVTPKTNYAVSKLQYTYKEGTSTKAVTVKQDDNGKYTFKMPERDITLKATFSKKTTSTKNPYSGDSSNIALWITMMAASAVGLTALVLLLIKSRKK